MTWMCVDKLSAIAAWNEKPDGAGWFHYSWLINMDSVAFISLQFGGFHLSFCEIIKQVVHVLTLVLDFQIQLQILLSSRDAEGAASVATAATQRHSQSVAAWSLCLQTLMQLESGDVGSLFQDALAHVNPKVHGALHNLFGHIHCLQGLHSSSRCNCPSERIDTGAHQPPTVLCKWVISLTQLVSILLI